MRKKIRSIAANQATGIAALSVFLCLTFASGCTTADRKASASEHHPSPDRVALAESTHPPEIAFKGYPRSKLEVADLGVPAVNCAALCANAGVGCVYFLPIVAAICLTESAMIVGIKGAMAPSAEAVRNAEADWRVAVSPPTIQRALREAVVSAAAARHQAFEESVGATDAVLDVSVSKVGLRQAGLGPGVQVYIEAGARLLGARDTAEIMSSTYLYEGERLTFDEWSRDRGERLARNLSRGYEWLGSAIFDDLFLRYAFPDPRPYRPGTLARAFGLASIEPPLATTTVASLTPTFAWERFPRDADVKIAPDEMSRVRDVTYDFIIAREENSAPVAVVYRREGLVSPRLALETPLAPATRFWWTVRARFMLDGRERVTEWSTTSCCRGATVVSPSDASYHFETPRDAILASP